MAGTRGVSHDHRVQRHIRVEEDILDLAMWIARDSREAASRFFESVKVTISDLRYLPGRGSPKQLHLARTADVRTWAVRGFPNHLIVYELRPGEVRVLAVVHGSRRYQRLIRKRVRR